ncbi:cytochrome c [Sulfitobacter aestuariivivens]|uniref:C-type cytochrome n=1 Tax=Sulfitobacter aestuariivivens TaxID=2766981 RepID=A0A927HDW7_9RHOB|nr:cytochrome c [Sulfitobacter aestuariivivens]MBD3662724.1 c-type cytochrome [Sulfitobacter aestuariivivens]
MKPTLIALTCLFALTGAAHAQGAGRGQDLFETHCATCHGLEGTGKGPMAPVLLLQPTNLRELAARNDGIFPTARVVMRIDGRDPLVSHGSPMPIYGDFFEGDDTPLKAETGQPIMTSRAIVDLVDYLERLQQ